LSDSIAFVTGMKDHGAAGSVGLLAAGAAGVGRHTVRASRTRGAGSVAGGRLPGMASPEQVVRRVERAEQDITAIGDTLLDIKQTVDSHTEELAAIRATLGEHGRTLAEHGRKLDGLDGRMGTLEERLGAVESTVSEGFAEILRRLDGR
jgi:septal ring factor EnvC (AmiA/AmiB activator)